MSDFPPSHDRVRILPAPVEEEEDAPPLHTSNTNNTRLKTCNNEPCSTSGVCTEGTGASSNQEVQDFIPPIGGRSFQTGMFPELPWMSVVILTLINLLNYVDRYTIAGVLLDVKDFYHIHNNEVGLLQTSFIISYMVFSPIFGYMGDRYSRKLIMAVGIFSWSIITLASSFISGERFWLFLLMRALVGIGEASYSTIAPTIIADLFVGTARTKALTVFYFAIPVGSGLGYIAGSNFAAAMGQWQWALRITPALGIVCVMLILLVVREPQRGAAEGSIHLSSSSWSEDLKYLLKHKSFMLSSAGFTCVAFIAGALALWTPTYMYYSIRQRPQPVDESTVSMKFGVITCVSGFIGVALGSWSASRLRIKWKSRADTYVCAFGLIGCAPFLFLALCFSKEYTMPTWGLIFIGETLLSLNWALVTDILLYIVVPNRRATAEAVQILMSHALGDAGSPYIVGQWADVIAAKEGFPPYRAGQYLSLQYSMYMCCFVAVIGGGFFLITSLYIEQDKARTQKIIDIAKTSTVLVGPQLEAADNPEMLMPSDSIVA